MLNFIIHGAQTSLPPVLIVHGLFGSARNWGVIAKRLSAQRQVITVDMRNHGHSFWDPVHSYPAMAEDLREVIATHGGRADVVGHSMGGKAVMMLALMHPDYVRKMVVADIAPVAYTHSQLDFIEAMQGVDLERVTRRSDAETQLAELGVNRSLQSFFTQSLDVDAGRWRLNLDALRDQMPQIMGFPPVETDFDGAVLFLTGGASDYVTRAHRPRIKALFPKARFAKIPGVGHWLHAEKPREFEAALSAFFEFS